MKKQRKLIKNILKDVDGDPESLIFELAKIIAKKESTSTSKAYQYIAYQYVGRFLDTTNVEKVLDELRSSCETSTFVVFNSVVFADAKAKHDKFLSYIKYKPKGCKGIYDCKCGSDEFVIWSDQIRSADEGMTNFRKCVRCFKITKSR